MTNVISNLGGGGAEHVMAILSNLWVANGKHVHVVVRSSRELSSVKVQLHPTIGVSSVIGDSLEKKWPPGTKKLGALIALRSAIRKSRPDLVIAYMDTTAVDTLLATIGTGIPVIVAEHCDPNTRAIGAINVGKNRSARTIRDLRSLIYGMLRYLLYPTAAAVVCLTETAMSYFLSRIQKNGRVIPNPVLPPSALVTHVPIMNGSRRVVYIGRMSVVKGLDRLLQAYAVIFARYAEWRLELWGEGPEQEHLVKLSSQLGIASHVRFAGWTDDSYSVLKGADLFVMSSYTEGFPMALCEAMACGVPPVSFDCPSGPRHIIRNGIDGLLVPNNDISALATAMDYLMNNDAERVRLASRAPEILERFGTKKVLAMWEELFLQVTRKRTNSIPHGNM